MCLGGLIMSKGFMTALGLPDKYQVYGPHPLYSKSAVLPLHSALMDRQYVLRHPYRTEPALKHQPECRTQVWSD